MGRQPFSTLPVVTLSRRNVAIILFILIVLNCSRHASGRISKPYYGVQEICQSESFNAECGAGEIIIIQRALYGRMKLGRCVTESLGFADCWKDVIDIADSMCSGLRTCEIRVPNAFLDQTEPCNKELKTYLEISYRCVTVATGDDENQACGSYYPQPELGGLPEVSRTIQAEEGYLSSSTRDACGSGPGSTTPWIIDALPGQSINLTLIDFALWTPGHSLNEGLQVQVGGSQCTVYGHVVETKTGVNRTICSKGTRGLGIVGGLGTGKGSKIERETHIFTSNSHRVDIQLLHESVRGAGRRFAVQFKMIGCPNLKPPSTASYLRDGDVAVITCFHAEKSWRLDCVNNRWIGVLGNCSGANYVVPMPVIGQFPLSNEMSIIAVVGIAVFLAVLIVILGLFCAMNNGRRPKCRRTADGNDSLSRYNYRGSDPEQDITSRGNYHMMSYDGRPLKTSGVASGPTPSTDLNDDAVAGSSANDYTHIWETPLPQQPFTPSALTSSAGGWTSMTPSLLSAEYGDSLPGVYSSTPRQVRGNCSVSFEPTSSGVHDVTTCEEASARGGDVGGIRDGPLECVEFRNALIAPRYFMLEKRTNN